MKNGWMENILSKLKEFCKKVLAKEELYGIMSTTT